MLSNRNEELCCTCDSDSGSVSTKIFSTYDSLLINGVQIEYIKFFCDQPDTFYKINLNSRCPPPIFQKIEGIDCVLNDTKISSTVLVPQLSSIQSPILCAAVCMAERNCVYASWDEKQNQTSSKI